MKLTFQQKALALVAILGLCAVAVDRLLLSNGVSGPHSASANAATTPDNVNQTDLRSPTVRSQNNDPGQASGSQTPGRLNGPTNHAVLGHRLHDLAADKHLDTADLPNAFALGAMWKSKDPDHPTQADPNRSDNPQSVAHVRSSQGKAYRLEAVLVDGQGQSIAIVGDRTLHVGDRLGGYAVVRIGPRSATFANASHKIKLQISH